MNISVIGTGYVGLVLGACFADVGHQVVCLDQDTDKMALLNDGGIPFHEPDLGAVVERQRRSGRLRFTASERLAVEHAEIVFIAVGTPAGEDGSGDTRHVLDAARCIGRLVRRPLLIVIKSTVPVGTADSVSAIIRDHLIARVVDVAFDVVSNPEFLRQGNALADFMHPDRIVIGADSASASARMRALYAPFISDPARVVELDVRSAELTKYAANAMLATRISFMNELAGVAERLGADIDAVRLGMGLDPRIGPHFLNAGAGYGGSCFPKDVKALIRMAHQQGGSLRILQATEDANERQKCVLFQKLALFFGGSHALAGKTIALWGLSFKPDTDDMREAPSLVLIRSLFAAGAKVRAYDPAAMVQARRLLLAEHGAATCDALLVLAASADDAVVHADALVLVTEWEAFRCPDFPRMAAKLRAKAVFDGRNLYDGREVMAAGLFYEGVGRRGTRHSRNIGRNED